MRSGTCQGQGTEPKRAVADLRPRGTEQKPKKGGTRSNGLYPKRVRSQRREEPKPRAKCPDKGKKPKKVGIRARGPKPKRTESEPEKVRPVLEPRSLA